MNHTDEISAHVRPQFAGPDVMRELATIGLVTLILLLPALFNGGPFIFFDTEQYFQIGKRLLGALAAPEQSVAAPVLIEEGAVRGAQEESGGLIAMAGGRAPTYSLLIAIVSPVFTIWGVAIIQALVCAWAIVRFRRMVFGSTALAPVLVVAAVLSVAGGLGFFAAFIMPDVLAGCLVLVMTVYLFDRSPSRGWARVEFWLLPVVMLGCASVHSTNLVLVLAAIPLAAIIVRLSGSSPRALYRRFAMIGAVALAAVALNAGYGATVKAATGYELRSPNLLLARVFADGTAAPYFERACAQNSQRHASCIFVGRTFADANKFLWESDPRIGGFLSLPPTQRTAVQDEEKGVVLSIILSEPVRQSVASLSNFAVQLVSTGIQEIHVGIAKLVQTDGWAQSDILAFTPDAQTCWAQAAPCQARSWQQAWDHIVWSFNVLVLPVAVIALGFVCVRLRAGAQLSVREQALMKACVLIAGLVVINAAVCGMLSGVNDRYQTRVLWALLLALVCLAPTLIRLVREIRTSRSH